MLRTEDNAVESFDDDDDDGESFGLLSLVSSFTFFFPPVLLLLLLLLLLLVLEVGRLMPRFIASASFNATLTRSANTDLSKLPIFSLFLPLLVSFSSGMDVLLPGDDFKYPINIPMLHSYNSIASSRNRSARSRPTSALFMEE